MMQTSTELPRDYLCPITPAPRLPAGPSPARGWTQPTCPTQQPVPLSYPWHPPMAQGVSPRPVVLVPHVPHLHPMGMRGPSAWGEARHLTPSTWGSIQGTRWGHYSSSLCHPKMQWQLCCADHIPEEGRLPADKEQHRWELRLLWLVKCLLRKLWL